MLNQFKIRHATERTKMAVVEGGRGAATVWQIVERFSYGTLAANTLKTGSTHQIRVHMQRLIGEFRDFQG